MAELFTTNPEKLVDILSEVEKGYIQLPDFQRGWVWDEDRIRNLLISVIKRFPIGAIMMLKSGGDNAKFASVELKNVQANGVLPKRLLLDGQQRLTSLYQALKFQNAVDTTDIRKKDIKRFFYFNIDEFLSDDIDEDKVVVITNEERFSKKTGTVEAYDYSTRVKECINNVFPANLSLDIKEALSWGEKYYEVNQSENRMQKFHKFLSKLAEMTSYTIPVISLTEENKKEAVCSVFENVNTGGVPLNVFELLTATFAADGYRLRQDWENYVEVELKNSEQDFSRVLKEVSNVDFLQSLTLLVTSKRFNQAVGCKRKHILSLTLDEYNKNRDLIMNGYIEVGRFLLMQSIFTHRDIPYTSQLIPLAAVFAATGKKATIAKSYAKLKRWYWNGVFGEMYGSSNDTRFVRDFVELNNWLNNDEAELPDTIRTFSFRTDRLDEMRTRNSAAYKGISACILSHGAIDFYKGYSISNITNFNSANIDIHHIFPKRHCEKNGIPQDKYDSIINKTAISYDTNRMIGGDAPSIYIEKHLDKDNSIEMTNMQLQSHLIHPEFIRNDDFEACYEFRKSRLVELIENATGNQVTDT